MEKLTNEDRRLVEQAKLVALKFSKEEWFCNETKRKRKISTVGAALISEEGKIYSGPNIFHPYASSVSICAESTAIAKAYSDGCRKIDTIVAYWYKNKNKQGILPPCGQCRELMRLFGNPWVIIATKRGFKKEQLNKLLPYLD